VFVETDTGSWSSYTNRNTNSAEAHPFANFHYDIHDMPIDVAVGMDFHYANLQTETYSSIERNNAPAKHEINTFNSGYFLTAQFNPLAALRFDTGARYNFIIVDSENKNTNKQAFVYELGAAYKPIDHINLYAKYSTLFRFPFTDEIVETVPSFYINEDLKPESGFNVEGGIRFNVDKWFALDANVFYMKLTDEIMYNVHNQNLDATQRIGTNVSLKSNPFDFLELQASYSYINAEFIAGSNKGKHIPLVPNHEVSGTVAFVLPWNINVGIDVDYRGTAFQDFDLANAQSKTDDYFLLSASVSYTLNKDNYQLSILLQGNNLFNTRYSPFVSYASWNPESGSAYYPANGREFNLSVQYRF
jgi:outer membrane receptor protein involved in Fe transport